LGRVVRLGAGPAVHNLTPVATEKSTPNTYSGIYGLETFPFHTDFAHWRYPPRYLMLRCVVGFEEVPTLLIDGSRLVQQVGGSSLSRSLVRPRRPVRGKLPLLRLYQTIGCDCLLRWDEMFFRPAGPIGKAGIQALRGAIAHENPISVALARGGDTLILDNWRMLHARSAIPHGCDDRLLERAYLEALN
jgi:alpha-ketoglutarate-dependent taurine dioxygenase